MRLPTLVLLLSCLGYAQKPSPMTPDPNMPRPIDGYDSVFLEELTWLEVRDAMRAGKTTVIIATGGVEQNGPYLALGKHNIILRATTEAIARKLGNALVAPIVAFVPEGDIDPPTGHMKYPGSISVTQDTFQRLLTDIASSMKTHGFRHIILIGDSGGNQQGMKEVAAELSAKWAGSRTTIHFIPEYYDYPGVAKWLETQGIHQVDEGIHDDVAISSQMMTVDPNTVRMKQRAAKGKLSINGVSLASPKGVEIGKKVVEYRATITVAAIRKAIGM
ncbi:MAG: creatininase family protein [Acidobacteria bacterium]|nr:creatininase family protein [Acidobacteriota bacterium]